MNKAIWDLDYDMHKDKCFDRPTCPECQVPLFDYQEENEHISICGYCEQEYELSDDMIQWFKDRQGCLTTKNQYCMSCGKNKMVQVSHKNVIDLKWQVAYGECENCGARFIV